MNNPQEIAPGNNPDQLTNEQVGEGYRLLTSEEIDARQEYAATPSRLIEKWFCGRWRDRHYLGACTEFTYRVPVSAGSFMSETAEPAPAELNPTQEQAAAWQTVYDKLASLPGFNESWQETDSGCAHALRTIDELVARAEKAEQERAQLAAAQEDKERLDFLSEHPESLPYLEDGLWRIPYLMDGTGSFGGGVCEMTHRTLRGVVDAARKETRK